MAAFTGGEFIIHGSCVVMVFDAVLILLSFKFNFDLTYQALSKIRLP